MRTSFGAGSFGFWAFVFATLVPGCFPEPAGVEGSCQIEPREVLDCRVPGESGGELVDVGLVGYSCTGSARPDLLEATYREGFPEGLLCADQGPITEDSGQGYCCTDEPVDCAYDPTSICEEGESGYECRGANRPESLNPAIKCGNGIRHDVVTEYCCSGTPEPPLCEQSDVVGCGTNLTGFLCQEGGHPRGENLGANESRPDYYRFSCATPEEAPNSDYLKYCCFAPPLSRDGASCVNHTAVPGCETGRFGFACYGFDTPEDVFLAMDCPEPAFEGESMEGYPATLYCCDLEQ